MRLNPFAKRPARRRAEPKPEPWLRPETREAIIGVVLVIASIIAILSFFSAAGPAGSALLSGIRYLFGFVGYVVPFIVGAVGVYLVFPSETQLPRIRVFGIGLVLVGLIGVFHSIGITAEDSLEAARDGRGGGLVGFALVWPLSIAFGSLASKLLFLATFIVGIFLSFNVSPRDVKDKIMSFLSRSDEEGETDEEESEDDEAEEEGSFTAKLPHFRISRLGSKAEPDPNQMRLEQQKKAEEEQRDRVSQQLRTANKKYRPPDINLLHSSTGKADTGDTNKNKEIIRTTLEKFGITVTMGKVNEGPTVAQYTLAPDAGVKLSRITALQNDLALALAAHPIRIEAPIPKTHLVGIEIPNREVSLVRLKELVGNKQFKQNPSPLTISLGKDVSGNPRYSTIEKMPHLLIAGATGSGKSIFVNTLIMSLLYRNSPSLVRFIMVDPKRVELSLYNGVPHLLTPVIMEPEKTINALKWAIREMDRRYRLLSESGSRNLMSYNANNPEEAMPYIVIIIDELADLMATHARDVEGLIVRLAQMARAIGIHLVLATQRPSVNVITGLIKANIPARVAFNVASQIDSRTILDGSGAEKLLGSGDMLYLSGDQARPVRMQGAYVSEEEVRDVVKDIVKRNPMDIEYDETIVTPSRESSVGSGENVDDDMFEVAKELVIESGKASASLLQRRLRVGYSRAARLLDMLEDQGIIGAQESNKPREVLVSAEDLLEDVPASNPGDEIDVTVDHDMEDEDESGYEDDEYEDEGDEEEDDDGETY